MRKLVYSILLTFGLIVGARAQVVNYAIDFASGSSVRTIAPIEELNGAKEYTFQLYFALDEWKSGGTLFAGDDLSLSLSAQVGELNLQIGAESTIVSNIPIKEWCHITVVGTQTELRYLINGVEVAVLHGDYSLASSFGRLHLGDDVAGRVDEFRAWSVALCDDDMLWRNTLNKFHPAWDRLVVYYKFDQELSNAAVVDYRGEHHALPSRARRGVKRVKVVDNTNFRYLVVSGYSSFVRHSDRLQIDRDMHLLTNDLIMLVALVDGFTGEVTIEGGGDASLSWQQKLDKIRAENYAGYRGYKVRLGLITHTTDESGEKVWVKSILRPEWRAQLVKDVEELLPYCDGIDVDFEWMYNDPTNPGWTAYGELVKELRAVMPADKILSSSLHPVSYTLPLDREVIDAIDYFTMQNYGPRPTYLYYEAYEKFLFDAVEYGIPAHKIHLSMATLAVRKDMSGKRVIGYKDVDFEGFTPQTNESTFGGEEYVFNSIDEVKRKSRLMVEQGSGGVMYFDMGNDVRVSDKRSLIRALNSVISSNVDSLVVNINKR